MLERQFHNLGFSVCKSIRYHSAQQGFFERLDYWTKVCTAFTGATAFGTIIGANTALGQWAAALAGLLTMSDIVFAYSAKARRHYDLYRAFSELAAKIELADQHSSAALRDLRAERLRIEGDEPPIHRNLEILCANEEALGRGITEPPYIREVKLHQRLCANFLSLPSFSRSK